MKAHPGDRIILTASHIDQPTRHGEVIEAYLAGLERLLANGAVQDGMIPKVESCVVALRGGVSRAHILDGRLPHALLLEFFTREGVGTMVTP